MPSVNVPGDATSTSSHANLIGFPALGYFMTV